MKTEGYKNKTRVRVGGLLLKDDAVLLVQLRSPITNQLVWMLPGGGLQFGETMKTCLQREFLEETGLQIRVGSLFAVNEVCSPPFHAVENYFKVYKTGGVPQLGCDPEHASDEQIIKDLQWVSKEQLKRKKVIPEQLKEWMRGASFDNRPKYSSQTI